MIFQAHRPMASTTSNGAASAYALGPAGYPQAERGDGLAEKQKVTLWTSGDPLGIAGMSALHCAISDGVEFHGAGNGAELPGSHPARLAAEQRLAHWHRQPAARVFLGGNGTLMSLVHALHEAAGPYNILLSDTVPHPHAWASLPLTCFDPSDPESLVNALETLGRDRPVMVVLESLSSRDGTIAPLPDICSTAEAHGALVIVDETHACGAYGPSGAGVAADQGCAERISLLCNAGSGSLGLPLGYLAGDAQLLELVTAQGGSRSSVCPPAFILDALPTAIGLVQKRDDLRARLTELSRELRAALAYLGLPISTGSSHVICIEVGDPRQTRLATSLLRDHYGIQVLPVLPPEVAPGHERLRVICSARHTSDDIEALTLGLETLAIEMGWMG